MNLTLNTQAIAARLFAKPEVTPTSPVPQYTGDTGEPSPLQRTTNGLPSVGDPRDPKAQLANLRVKVRVLEEQHLVIGRAVGELQRQVATLKAHLPKERGHKF